MLLTRRECFAAMAIMSVASGCKYAPASDSASTPVDLGPASDKTKGGSSMAPLKNFTPEDFGATGDGRTNDTDAFASMTAAVNSVGGGTVLLRKTTYIVGGHVPDPTGLYAYAPIAIMEFAGCDKALTIIGNGARLRCADGLRFGTFDPSTGLPTQHAMPYYGTGELSSPYAGMISVQNCAGKVHIEDLELDGNVDGLLIGGPRGDLGWQMPASGLRLINNLGGEEIVDVHSHHHALDGIYIDGAAERETWSQLKNVHSEFNARQGCSIVGGRNYSFANCKFNHTGRGRLTSAPSAGVDIEAETKPVRNLIFAGCEFSNNAGAGMVADSGDSEGATFDDCLFVGTSTWAAWPAKPHFRFLDCYFVGSICRAFPDPDPERATQFSRCSFLDDPALSPTNQVFGGAIANLGGGDSNVLFDGCKFTLKDAAVLPWTLTAKYQDCTMSQAARDQAYPRGTFTGINRIDGNVDLYSSKVIGQLTVNGQIVPPTNFIGG